VTTPVLLALLACCVVAVLAWVLPLGRRGSATAGGTVRLALVALLPVALAAAAVAAASADPAAASLTGFGVVLGVAAAVLGGGPVTAAVLRLVPEPDAAATAAAAAAAAAAAQALDPNAPPAPDPTATAAEVLRGGATIGVLERGAICVSVLLGWPEGIAVVLAVKGLGRYPELRSPGTSERFIIGTFASVLWSLACAGVVALAL
jgi:hypothetical protein